MKLSFSTNHWDGGIRHSLDVAAEYGFSGVELHSVDDLGGETPASVYHRLIELGLKIPCVDLTADIGFADQTASAMEELKTLLPVMHRLRAPYLRLRATKTEAAGAFLEQALPLAEREGVVLLVETTGAYADTAALRDLLGRFSSDSLGALWDIHHPYHLCGESPEDTIRNLGAYVRHVHVKDSTDAGSYCLIGEGVLPIDECMDALRSVNYDGYICLEWDPAWVSEFADMDLIFTHFVSFMSRYNSLSRAKTSLYHSNDGKGCYVWKKDALIEKTFSQVLDTMVREFPDQTAIKYTTLDYTRTYAQFRDDVDDFARALIDMGVKAGSHVAVWATNIPQWYIAFWAVTKIGGVLVTVNTAYKIHEAEYLLRQSDTHTLIMVNGYRDSDYATIMNELCPELAETKVGAPLRSKRLPFLRNIITVGFAMKGAMTWEFALSRKSKVPVEEVYRMAAAVDVHDVCNMQYTSGTTGFPKGVMLTHYNIVNNGKCIGDRMDLSTADRMMIQVPMFHCFGMVLAMTASMTHGATILPLPYFSPKPALSCIHQEHITAFHGVPTMFIAMLEHADFEKTDFSYMRTGIMAGSPCPISVMQDVVNKMNMSQITIVYGQTEASPGCTMSSTDDPIEVRVATVGRALPEIECKIVDPETGLDCPDNVTGEFVARGYNIMKGYYKMPRATAAAIDQDGWLHTGDLACRTPEGNYRITGRLKDMIIRGGENIYPKEIEEFIYTHPKVRDVQVIGVPDEQYGEEIMACIILKDGETMTEAEMKTYIRDHMAKHKVPRYVDFVDSFPMNVAGKILKYQMRKDAIEKLGLQKANSIETA